MLLRALREGALARQSFRRLQFRAPIPNVRLGSAGLSTTSAATDVLNSVPDAAVRVVRGFPDLSLTTSYLQPGEGHWVCSSWMRTIVTAHDMLGLEWWAAIIAVSAGIRLAIAPLFFRQIVAGARFQQHTANTIAFQHRMSAVKGDNEALKAIVLERRAYFIRHGLRLRDIFIPTGVQIVVAATFFWALRRMSYEAHLIPGFVTGGVGSFTALYAPDSAGMLFGLPFLSTSESSMLSVQCPRS